MPYPRIPKGLTFFDADSAIEEFKTSEKEYDQSGRKVWENDDQINIRGVRSPQKVFGQRIYSGQKVVVHGRIAPVEVHEVKFDPLHGFKVQGNNFADAHIMTIYENISWWDKLCGAVDLFCYNLFKR